jgi:hypothetical protein
VRKLIATLTVAAAVAAGGFGGYTAFAGDEDKVAGEECLKTTPAQRDAGPTKFVPLTNAQVEAKYKAEGKLDPATDPARIHAEETGYFPVTVEGVQGHVANDEFFCSSGALHVVDDDGNLLATVGEGQ